MSKTRRRYHKDDFFEDDNDYEPQEKKPKDKRTSRRVDRAIRIKDLDQLISIDEEDEV